MTTVGTFSMCVWTPREQHGQREQDFGDVSQ
jgi:hypothetical protein